MERMLRFLIAAALALCLAVPSFAATRGLRIKDAGLTLVEVIDGVATGEISVEPGETSPNLEVFWLDDVLAEVQPASPPFSKAGTITDPGVATYASTGTWTFQITAVSEGMTDLTLELLDSGVAQYTSPPIEVHVEPAFSVDGLVLRKNGQVLASVWQGVASGQVHVGLTQVTDSIFVSFLDADSVEFVPTEPALSLVIAMNDTARARTTFVTNWALAVEGLELGVTSLVVKVEHEGHFDFVSPAIPVHVNQTVSVPLASRPGTTLEGAAPNPVRDATTLRFSLARAGEVELSVFDVAGRRVAELHRGSLAAGGHALPWSPSGLAGGVYLVRLRTADGVFSRRVAIGH
jgi:hypothetical protein